MRKDLFRRVRQTCSATLCMGTVICATQDSLFADARFLSTRGKVQVFENGRWAKAELTHRLTEQSSVQVGYRSGAVVGLQDGSQISLKQNSVLSFNHLGTDIKHPQTEVMVVQGGLSAFVKKPEGNVKNVFHVRTPTMVVGVRGSFLEMSKRGEEHRVTAVESAAFIRNKATASTTRERLQKAFAVLERAYLIDRNEERRAVQKISTTKSSEDSEAFKAIVKPTFENPEIKAGIKDINDHKTLVRELIARQRILLTQKNADRKTQMQAMLRIRALTMLQLAWAEAAYRAELDAHLLALKQADKKKQIVDEDEETFLNTISRTTIPQGDSARASGDIEGPLSTRIFNSRSERNFSAGSTAAERGYLGGNTDSQSGFGNDVQGLYNSINSVTQPSAVGEPTLRRF